MTSTTRSRHIRRSSIYRRHFTTSQLCAWCNVWIYLLSATILNLLLVSCMVAWGVAAAGCARYIIFAIGLLPSVIYQVASVSGDTILFGLTLLFLGHLARAMQAEVIVGRIAGALRPMLGARLHKAELRLDRLGDARLLGPSLARCSRRRYACAAIVMVSPLVVHGFLIVQGFQAAPIAPGIDAVGNWHETLEHPFKFLWMISHVIEAYPVGTRWNLWQSTIGKLGWLDAPLFMPLYPILTASLFLAAGFPGSIVSWRVRIFLLALAFGSVCCVALPIRIYAIQAPPTLYSTRGKVFHSHPGGVGAGLLLLSSDADSAAGTGLDHRLFDFRLGQRCTGYQFALLSLIINNR